MTTRNDARRGDPNHSTHVALDRIAVVKAEGKVDRAGLEACDYLITRAGPDTKLAVVDLSNAETVDYRAVTILVARRRVLKAKGGELAVAASRREVRDVIRATAGGELQLFPTVAEAVSYLHGDEQLVVAGAAAAKRPKPR